MSDVVTSPAPAAADAAQEMASSPTQAQLNLQLKEVTSMLQERTNELSSLRKQHVELKAWSDANSARVAFLESSLASAQGGSGGSAQDAAAQQAALKAKDDELAALRAKSNALIDRVDRLESESVAHRVKGEAAAARVAAEKDDEIVALKEMFTQVSEKRKESFLQIKERLKAAVDMVSKLQEQTSTDARTIASLQAQLATTAASLKERMAQVADYDKRVKNLESEKGDLFQRTSDELQTTKSEARESAAKVETLSAELEKATAAAKLVAEREARQADSNMVLESEQNIAENGRPIRITGTSVPSDAEIQWWRSFRGSAFQPIPGRSSLVRGREYTPTVDDIGAVLKAEVILPGLMDDSLPVPVSREVGPVGSKRSMVLSIQEHLKKAEIVFNVESAYASTETDPKKAEKSKPQILLNKEKIKLRAGGKTIAKASWGDALRITLEPDSLTRFTVAVDASQTPITYSAPNALERDLIVQTIRSYNQAQMLHVSKTMPNESVLALAYLIRTSNEQRVLAMLRRADAGGREPNHLPGDPSATPRAARRASEADGFGFGAGSGNGDSTTPSHSGGMHTRPPARSISGLSTPAPGIIADTPQSQLNATASTPRGSKLVGAAPAAAAAATPVAVAKIQGSNGEELEVDADGFVIRRETGWGDAGGAAKADKPKDKEKDKSAAAGGGSDDDFSDVDEDPEAMKPSFQMKINAEARPIASAADLRRHSVLEPPAGAVAALAAAAKEKKKKEKAEKKEKKEKKKREKESGGGGGDSPAALDTTGDVTSPNAEASPSSNRKPEESPSSTSVQASAAGDKATPAGSPQNSAVAASSSAAAAAPAAATAVAPSNPDELFAFLDAEASSKAPPSLGATPKGPAPPAALPPVPAASSSSPSSALSSTVSPKKPLSSNSSGAPSVDILVLETLHARILDGDVIEYAVWGEILLASSSPLSAPARFEFQLFNTDAISKLAPNEAVLQSGSNNTFVATLPAGSGAAGSPPLCVLKYKVNTDLASAKRQVPLSLRAAWQCTPSATAIDVSYALSSSVSYPRLSLTDVKFLVAVAPEACVKSCAVAVPKCMFSPQSQKLMWQLPALPAQENQARSGTLHAELHNNDVAATPTPLSVSFVSDELEAVPSGLLVAESDSKRSGDGQQLVLGKIINKIKSGVFSVL